MPTEMPALSPAVLAQTREAAAQFQLAANAPAAGGYKLLYITVPGCGGFHSYDNLRRAQAMGIDVQYMNVFSPGQPFIEKDRETGKPVRAPGGTLSLRAGNTVSNAFNFLQSKQLDASEATHAVLLGPDGRPIHEFASTKGNFIQELQRYLPPAFRSQGRSNIRS